MLRTIISGLYPLCVLLYLSAFKPDHALYIGVVQIVQEQADTSATIQVKVFSDDLQSVLQNQFDYSDIPALSQLCEKEELIQEYFQDKLLIEINDQSTLILLENCESINDVYLLTFRMKHKDSWKSIQVKADFFMELFPTQSNVINLAYTPSTTTVPVKKMGRMQKGEEPLVFEVI